MAGLGGGLHTGPDLAQKAPAVTNKSTKQRAGDKGSKPASGAVQLCELFRRLPTGFQSLSGQAGRPRNCTDKRHCIGHFLRPAALRSY